MLKNYLKIAYRTMRQQKLYSGLNVFGLAIGLACAIVIFVFVQHELSYDRFHENADRIHRIIERQPGNVFMGNDRFVVTPASLAGELASTFPEIERAVTLRPARQLLQFDETSFYERGLWAGEAFLEMFDYPLSVGNEHVLSDPSHIVLTESLAKKMFGENDPIGQHVETEQWGDRSSFVVAGVLKDLPSNTFLSFEYVLPISAHPGFTRDLAQRTNNSYHTFFMLRDGADAGALQEKMPAFVLDYLGEEWAPKYEYYVQALSDIHLRSDANFDIGATGNAAYVYLFGSIGMVILLLACVNYMNLAVARSMKRAKEVGMRQVIGARRFQVAGQFICESVLMAFLALIVGLALVHLFLPVFSSLVDRTLSVDWLHPLLAPALTGLMLVVGLVSGSYPALYMARMQPVQSLKGRHAGAGGSWLQRALIVLQYTASIALIAGGIIMYRQFQFIQNKELGYNREHVVSFSLMGDGLRDNIDLVLAETKRLPHVLSVTGVSDLPTNIGSSQGIREWEGRQEGEEMQLYQAFVGNDFFDVFEIDLVAGRHFSSDFASDSTTAYILNETAVRALGWTPDGAVGNRIKEDGMVVGVMRDFHMHSMHLPIAPLMLANHSGRQGWYGQLAVRVEPTNMQATIAAIEEILDPLTAYPVTYRFVDEVFDDLYKADVRVGQTIGYFAFLAILIASLGLFGLAAYATERRSKEVGVRKVLGASVTGLVSLLSREFLALVVISVMLAAPIGYFAMQTWLEDFAYRIEIGPGVFLMTALIAMAIAVLTVSYQAVRTALSNPVDALRYE